MPEHTPETHYSRRGFLKAIAATAAAATAVGAGAAALVETQATVPAYGPLFPTVTPAVGSVAVSAPVSGGTDSLAQMAANQAENLRLQAELDAAHRRLSGLDQSLNTLQQSHLALQEALQTTQTHTSLLEGLVGLYEQLEQVDVGATVMEGMSAVGSALTGWVDGLPGVSQGLAQGAIALDRLESDLPWLDEGRRWLVGHLALLSRLMSTLEVVLRVVLDKTEPFLILLADWFADVLRWLPFGLGDKAAQVVEALTALLQETPNSITGMHTYGVARLEKWLGALDEPEPPLLKEVIRPIRENAIAAARTALTQAQTLQTTYVADLEQPATQMWQQSAALRQQIAQYRQEHQV